MKRPLDLAALSDVALARAVLRGVVSLAQATAELERRRRPIEVRHQPQREAAK